MDQALEDAKNHLLEVTDGTTTLLDLPLLAAPRGKKSMKQLVRLVRNVPQVDCEAIVSAFAGGTLNVAAFPASVRPVKMQIVMEDAADAHHVLKFFHSKVDIPLGLGPGLVR